MTTTPTPPSSDTTAHKARGALWARARRCSAEVCRSFVARGWARTFQRWLDLLALATLSAALLLVVFPAVTQPKVVADAVRLYGGAPSILEPLSVLVAAFIARHAWVHRKSVLGTRRFLRYPPTWFAAFMGAPLLFIYGAHRPDALAGLRWFAGAAADGPFQEHAGLAWRLLLGITGAAVAVSAIAAAVGHGAPSESSNVEKPSGRLPEPKALRQWLVDDRPIQDPSQDRFALQDSAARIAARLRGSWASCKPSIAIVGALGSGKTTLRGLTEHALQKVASVRVVPVSLWQYETPDAAIMGALEELLRAVSQYVDAPALKGIPQQYLDAIEGAGGGWTRVFRLAREPTSASELLAKIDRVACAIQQRFVLWVEDLERLGGAAQPLPFTPQTMRAFLFLVDELASVTVVIASTRLHLREDSEKLVRLTEHIAELRVTDVQRILVEFRAECMKVASGLIILDPPDHELAAPADEELVAMLRPYKLEPRNLTQATRLLLRNPRSLKFALRGCLEAWDSLKGEISFEDLLLASVLRASEPEAFAFVDSNLSFFRNSPARTRTEDEKKDKSALFSELENRVSIPERRKAVALIVRGLFERGNLRGRPGLQALARALPVDYWRRMLTASVPADSDQPYLHAVQNRDVTTVLSMLAEPERSARLVQFGVLLPWDTLMELLDRLLGALTEGDSRSWPVDMFGEVAPPGLKVIAALVRASDSFDGSDLLAHLSLHIEPAMRRNTGLVHTIETWLATPSSADPEHLHSMGGLRVQIEEALLTVFRGAPRDLADALRTSRDSRTLARLVWGLAAIREGMRTPPFESWPTFASTVLEAATLSPTAVLPQIASMLVDSDEERRPVFNRERAQELFRLDELAKVFAMTSGNSDDPRVDAAHRALAHE